MIQMQSDYLFFQTPTGEAVPCSAQKVTVELIGSVGGDLDPELVQHAAEAVLHYFKFALHRNSVSVAEFARALECVLDGLGLTVHSEDKPSVSSSIAELDLRHLACAAGKGYELVFFQGLRKAMRRQLSSSPRVLRFIGLRGCVKQLTGAHRWNGRCDRLHGQILSYLRGCFDAEARPRAGACTLVVR